MVKSHFAVREEQQVKYLDSNMNTVLSSGLVWMALVLSLYAPVYLTEKSRFYNPFGI